jgi:hypothetical protein
MRDAERRHVCRLIDFAVERCEDANLREQLAVPRWIADLVVHLQAAAGEEPLVPRHTIAAQGVLLDLRRHYMPKSSPLETSDPELERRLCTSCHRPMSPLCRQSVCTECRRLQRLVKRAAAALAS